LTHYSLYSSANRRQRALFERIHSLDRDSSVSSWPCTDSLSVEWRTATMHRCSTWIPASSLSVLRSSHVF